MAFYFYHFNINFLLESTGIQSKIKFYQKQTFTWLPHFLGQLYVNYFLFISSLISYRNIEVKMNRYPSSYCRYRSSFSIRMNIITLVILLYLFSQLKLYFFSRVFSLSRQSKISFIHLVLFYPFRFALLFQVGLKNQSFLKRISVSPLKVHLPFRSDTIEPLYPFEGQVTHSRTYSSLQVSRSLSSILLRQTPFHLFEFSHSSSTSPSKQSEYFDLFILASSRNHSLSLGSQELRDQQMHLIT